MAQPATSMSPGWLGTSLLILGILTAGLLNSGSAQLPQDLLDFELPQQKADHLLADQDPAAAPFPQLVSEGRAEALNGKRLSLNLKPELRTRSPLPEWCRDPADRTAGPWHQLSDDEYTNESPYLLCGLSDKGQRSFNVQRSSRRRAAHALPTRGAFHNIRYVAIEESCQPVHLPKLQCDFQ